MDMARRDRKTEAQNLLQTMSVSEPKAEVRTSSFILMPVC